jgi:DNA-binding response OmpR family regulator
MPSTDRKQYTVLVVDDAEAHRYAIARGLRAEGFETLEAGTGKQALELAPQVAAVVLDVNLPDIDGMEVCRQLRGAPATAKLPVVHVSAVFITGYHRAKGEHAGADEYMVTPVDSKVLASRLDTLIAARRTA